MAAHPRIIIIFIISLLLAGCANPVVTNDAAALPSLSDAVTATPDTSVPVIPPASTPTTEPTQAAIIEPVLPPPQVDLAVPPVNPPSNFMEALHASQADHGAFDLIDAHAMYAHYRQEVGIRMWSTPDFIKAMDTYYETVLKPRGIELKQATTAGITYSLLTKGSQILLQFTPEGAWANYAPGGWNDQSQQIWVDAGGPVEIVIGPGNLPYLARLDPETREVTAYLNPINAKLDNIANQWVPVVDGIAQMRWDGKALISLYDRRTKQGDLVPLLAIGERGRLLIWDQAKNDYQSVQVMVETSAGTAFQALRAERIEITGRGLAAFDSQDNVIFLVDAAGKTFAAADNAITFDSGKLAWDKAAESWRPGFEIYQGQLFRFDGILQTAVPVLDQDGQPLSADQLIDYAGHQAAISGGALVALIAPNWDIVYAHDGLAALGWDVLAYDAATRGLVTTEHTWFDWMFARPDHDHISVEADRSPGLDLSVHFNETALDAGDLTLSWGSQSNFIRYFQEIIRLRMQDDGLLDQNMGHNQFVEWLKAGNTITFKNLEAWNLDTGELEMFHNPPVQAIRFYITGRDQSGLPFTTRYAEASRDAACYDAAYDSDSHTLIIPIEIGGSSLFDFQDQKSKSWHTIQFIGVSSQLIRHPWQTITQGGLGTSAGGRTYLKPELAIEFAKLGNKLLIVTYGNEAIQVK